MAGVTPLPNTQENDKWGSIVPILEDQECRWELEKLVVGMMIGFKDILGRLYLADEMALILSYRGAKVWKIITPSVLRDTYETLKLYQNEPSNPFREWRQRYEEEPRLPQLVKRKAQLERDRAFEKEAAETRASTQVAGEDTARAATQSTFTKADSSESQGQIILERGSALFYYQEPTSCRPDSGARPKSRSRPIAIQSRRGSGSTASAVSRAWEPGVKVRQQY